MLTLGQDRSMPWPSLVSTQLSPHTCPARQRVSFMHFAIKNVKELVNLRRQITLDFGCMIKYRPLSSRLYTSIFLHHTPTDGRLHLYLFENKCVAHDVSSIPRLHICVSLLSFCSRCLEKIVINRRTNPFSRPNTPTVAGKPTYLQLWCYFHHTLTE